MIRTVSGESVSRFLSASFLDLMSHFCDTEIITPCEGEECVLTEAEWNAVPEELIENTMSSAVPAFEEAGGIPFIRKKIAQLIKIAKAEKEIQLDLVSELILYLIGLNCITLSWEDADGQIHYPDETFDYPERQELLEELRLDPEEFEDEEDFDVQAANDETEAAFDSFWSLMRINEEQDGYVFFDDDFTFLLDADDVAEGLHNLYKAVSDYDRKWHARPWTDIGEEVPPVVAYELDAVEVEGINFGGVSEMRSEYAKAAMDNLYGKKD